MSFDVTEIHLINLSDIKFLLTYKEETSSQTGSKEKRRKRKGEAEKEVMDPLEYYEAVKLQKKGKKEAKEAAFR